MRTIDKILAGVWIALAAIIALVLVDSIIEGGNFSQYITVLLLIGVILTMYLRLDWAYKDKEASDAALAAAEALLERYRESARIIAASAREGLRDIPADTVRKDIVRFEVAPGGHLSIRLDEGDEEDGRCDDYIR